MDPHSSDHNHLEAAKAQVEELSRRLADTRAEATRQQAELNALVSRIGRMLMLWLLNRRP
jgi:uncharacterized coiled-coil protein SlyX